MKTFYLAKDLLRWRKNKPKISDQLKAIENQVLQMQMRPLYLQNTDVQKDLDFQHHTILAKDEAYHRQRYKKNWSVRGDRNSSFSINPLSKEPEGTPSLIFRIQMAPSPLPRINWPRLLIIILLTFSDLIPLLMQEMIYKSGCNRQSKAVNKGRTLSLIPFQICRNFTIL
jgi:hypothetical protein